jgi:FAD/FMN-containing dehydrogenase
MSSAGLGTGPVLNDVHSGLNATRVHEVVQPRSVADIQLAIRRARETGVSICGARHAMGGQQFGTDTLLLDMMALNRVLSFDRQAGTIEVEAGIQWPALIEFMLAAQAGADVQWGIVQKQTGADSMTLGGALAANVHGRGLRLEPIIADVEAFTLVDAGGELRRCSRTENADLFRLAIGGYGLFGVISSITLRLCQRQKLQRVVEIKDVQDVMAAFRRRIDEGFLYGDFQYSIDAQGEDFLRRGVFSCYRPIDVTTPIPEAQRVLSQEDWQRLLYLSHVDKRRAVDTYVDYYQMTSGQIYWSDTHQLSDYFDGYHAWLDGLMNATVPASEIISEIYVPRDALAPFFDAVRTDFRRHQVDVIYGTVRLIERDDESFLAWAREPYACVIFNLHANHSPAGIQQVSAAFRRLIDLGIEYGGSYFLTYHRYARREQVERCYPQFPQFLRLKRQFDTEERFQSDWYRHYRQMFAGVL